MILKKERNVTRAEANRICEKFSKLETTILLSRWYDILQCFDKSSKTFHCTTTDFKCNLKFECNLKFKCNLKYVQITLGICTRTE